MADWTDDELKARRAELCGSQRLERAQIVVEYATQSAEVAEKLGEDPLV